MRQQTSTGMLSIYPLHWIFNYTSIIIHLSDNLDKKKTLSILEHVLCKILNVLKNVIHEQKLKISVMNSLNMSFM